MKVHVVLASIVAALSSFQVRASDDVANQTIVGSSIQEVATTTEIAANVRGKLVEQAYQLDSIAAELDLGSMVNMGAKIWDVIKENRAVAEASSKFANALPKGVTSGAELTNFSELQMKSYRIQAWNIYGITIYDVIFTMVHQYGGKMRGVGQYLETVSIVPTLVYAFWGQTVGLNVSNVVATNIGTDENPLASVMMESVFSVKNIFQHKISHMLFMFRGDSPTVKHRLVD